MRDKRPVDELSLEELERILRLKKRETRMQDFRRVEKRVVIAPDATPPTLIPSSPPPVLPISEAQEVFSDEDDMPRFEDDYAPRPIRPTETRPLWQGLLSRFLLVGELSAILGLFALLYVAYQGIMQVNANIEKSDLITATSEAALQASLIKPTATALIAVGQVILPGGHVWNPDGQHQFNITEVPAPYRSTFQQQLEAPRTQIQETPPGGPIRVVIPAINVDASIRSGDDWVTLQASVGHHPYSGNPGRNGNVVLTAHNDIFGEVFKRIEELSPGDEIRIQSSTGEWYTYRVREKQAVEPTEVWVLDQNLGQSTPITTLITCYPYRVNTHRMVVFAELVS